MNRRGILTVAAMTLLGVALLPDSAVGQQKSLKEQLVGTWTFVSSTGKRPDGSPTWGSNPKGLLIFMENGRFSLQIMRSDRPKYASNNRLKGTPEEHKATVEGTISNFGTYSVDEPNKTVTLRFEASSFPNSEGTEQKRTFTITGDELKYTNPAPTIGGPPTELVWRRAG
jgi:hypothetical protein